MYSECVDRTQRQYTKLQKQVPLLHCTFLLHSLMLLNQDSLHLSALDSVKYCCSEWLCVLLSIMLAGECISKTVP